MKDFLTPSILAVGAMMREDVPGLLSLLTPFYHFPPLIKQLQSRGGRAYDGETHRRTPLCLGRTDSREKEKERETEGKQEGREDTVWPIDPIVLRPSLLCGHAGRISVSRSGLILVSLAGHLLLKMSKFVHLLSRKRRNEKAENCYVMAPVEFKAPVPLSTTSLWSF